jgi:DNA-binding transcriptional MerR regulator
MASEAMEKSPEAFRTIREVAEAMDLPQHVLRFWETRFPQIRPLKRAGGRRYYRPEDVERLRLIKRLLYDEGYTIKGVQKLFKEQGVQNLAMAARLPFGPAEPFVDDGEEAPAPEVEAEDSAAPAALQTPAEAGGKRAFARELDALRSVLAEILEARRILAQARTQRA